MATATIGNFDATGEWVNLVAETLPVNFGAIASVETFVQNFGTGSVAVWAKASGSAPTEELGGIILLPYHAWTFTAAQIWVKALDGSAKISATTL